MKSRNVSKSGGRRFFNLLRKGRSTGFRMTYRDYRVMLPTRRVGEVVNQKNEKSTGFRMTCFFHPSSLIP
jgi:hypothetical protein